MLVLKRHQLFLIGVTLIALFYFLNKTWFIIQSATTTGICDEYEIIYPEGRQFNPDRYHSIIHYTVDGKEYEIRSVENVKLEKNEAVTVIYNRKDPSDALQFSFLGFWYYGILYSILSVLLLVLICYGAFEKHHRFRIRIPFMKKPDDHGKPNKGNSPRLTK